MKDNFSIITSPCVTKTSYWNAYMMNEMHTFLCSLLNPRPHLILHPPQPLSKEKKMVGYLLYFLNYGFVVQDVQEMSPLLSLKNTGECTYALWAWKVFYFVYTCCVTTVSWHWTQIEFAFYSLATFWIGRSSVLARWAKGFQDPPSNLPCQLVVFPCVALSWCLNFCHVQSRLKFSARQRRAKCSIDH